MPSPPMWAPWRMDYILADKPSGCAFCSCAVEGASPENLVLGGGELAFVVLNRHPYSSGHLMVIPRAHIGELSQLASTAWAECSELLRLAVSVVEEVLGPDGFNLGMNLGEAAGAGIPGHLHWHLVPRWSGDTNFMPMLADVRVIPEHLEATWRKLQQPLSEALAAAGFKELIP